MSRIRRGTTDFRPASRVETISIMAFKAGTICNVATVFTGFGKGLLPFSSKDLKGSQL